tara:strand:- start:7488 stop:8195 length:708 start_codon:yes stop_codon:yes gene_type:complete
MGKSIIVARFNEDISWLKPYNDFNLVIYNKGLELPNFLFKNIFNIKNVGRESHTWLHHIVKNYHNLDDINIFLQGRIDDLGCMAHKNPHQYLKEIDKYGFAASRYGILGPSHWKWHVGIDKDIRYKEKWENGSITRSKIGFRSFAKKFFPEIPWIVATSYGGCFAVKKELIRYHNLNFYKTLLDILSAHKNPIEGHYMERLWCYMFTKNKPIFESFFHVIKTKSERLKFRKLQNY